MTQANHASDQTKIKAAAPIKRVPLILIAVVLICTKLWLLFGRSDQPTPQVFTNSIPTYGGLVFKGDAAQGLETLDTLQVDAHGQWLRDTE